MTLEGGLPAVQQCLREVETHSGRPAGSVRLVAVTKGRSLEEIRERVLAYGHYPLAENRGQELRDKREAAQAQGGEDLEWHFIGPLQLNKIKYLRGVTLVHTLERLEQARELARLAESWGRAPELLIQVHNGEAQKHGVPEEGVAELRRQAEAMGLVIRGLMVMAPYGDLAEAARVFGRVAALGARLELPELSMGMSDDYVQAVQAGATMVRVGRALFE
ncbi:YggS family pyridoxal phosphate-dependent enzyme [Deinobacterium chartae]|nr:YggS family pyridoxal phosphate-dependent enzyme [Deinobacterium chartae]